jgi:type I restriction enzyme M protein
MAKNMFCDSKDLKNEADVESLFVERILKALEYPDNKILRKKSITEITISKGSKKEKYKPDYVLLDSAKEPIIVLDAKHPNETPQNYHYQVSGYAHGLNEKYAAGKNPVRYSILTNGLSFIVYPWDSDKPVFYLRFEDFQPFNEKWLELRANLSYTAFKQVVLTKDVFQFEKPELTLLIRTFNDCHNLIRKKDSLSPTDAFYEFSKIMFIKIREDKRVHEKFLRQGASPKRTDFIFSDHWIDNQATVEPNPINNILFRQIQEELEKKIQTGEKKRIFDKGEQVVLKASTVYEVVKSLQHFDLFGIDEDLNGRMFETFLNATVRGKDLGQFFTPRAPVHYMVETAAINIVASKKNINENIPYILDGCCGSGGFLIDCMAEMSKQVNRMSQLTNSQKQEYLKEIKNDHLFGIDANYKIARISRLNMYLHGDGGSKIFKANALDKEFTVDQGMSDEEKEGLKELRSYLDPKSKNQTLFDTVLTNPPFSINYKSSDDNEKRILEQFDIAKIGGRLSSSESSNVLFMDRYKDLIKPNTGELLTVLDDTVLNGEQSQGYRDYILEHFVIIQVLSLPFNTFFRANANIKTSIIHLRRRQPEEKQGSIFMAITNNIGHDDHQRETPDRNNLPYVTKKFFEWKTTGKLKSDIVHNEDPDEPLGCPLQVFEVKPEELNLKRFDAFYYAPELQQAKKEVMDLFSKGKIDLKKGSSFNIIPSMKSKEVEDCEGKQFKYFEIGDVTPDGSIVKCREDLFESLPTRARLKVQTNDVIFAKNNSSRGTTVLIPPWFNGNLVTTGFIGIRPKDYEESLILWSVMESEFFRKQVYYYAITASQPEVRDTIFKQEMLIPYPKTKVQKDKIIQKAKVVDSTRNQLKKSLNEVKDTVNKVLY